MKLEVTNTVKLVLTDLMSEYQVDPISIYLDDYGPGRGKITIECYGEVWSSYWGAMGKSNIVDFFISCDNQYLSKNLAPGISSTVVDYDRICEDVEKYFEHNGDYLDDEISDKSTFMSFADRHPEVVCEIYGEEWFIGNSLPYKDSGKYNYLNRIVNATRDGLKKYKELT